LGLILEGFQFWEYLSPEANGRLARRCAAESTLTFSRTAYPCNHGSLEEVGYFSQVVRRVAAILLLGPGLDASYQAILTTAFGLPG
jgi:hypothetical protein